MTASDLRIGVGVDAHAFGDGVALVLGGVTIDHPRGLVGHSDGDVVAHALTDALLGAAGLADIGALFPSDDERYRGADSLALLADAYGRVRAAGFDAGQRRLRRDRAGAKVAPYREEMRRRLAAASASRKGGSTSARRRPTGSASPAAARGWRRTPVALLRTEP